MQLQSIKLPFHRYNWELKRQKLEHNREYWTKKIERNIASDRDNDFKLFAMNWIPLNFWGQEIKKHISECVETVEDLVLELQIIQLDAMIENDNVSFEEMD